MHLVLLFERWYIGMCTLQSATVSFLIVEHDMNGCVTYLDSNFILMNLVCPEVKSSSQCICAAGTYI